MNLEAAKEALRLWYGRAAQFYLFQTMVLYVIACVATGHPLGPARFAAFLNHLFTFK